MFFLLLKMLLLLRLTVPVLTSVVYWQPIAVVVTAVFAIDGRRGRLQRLHRVALEHLLPPAQAAVLATPSLPAVDRLVDGHVVVPLGDIVNVVVGSGCSSCLLFEFCIVVEVVGCCCGSGGLAEVWPARLLIFGRSFCFGV